MRSLTKEVTTVLRFLRLKEYLGNLLGIPFLIWLISPEELLTTKTALVLTANTCLTAFTFSFNDIEDAEDDSLDLVKRERNVVANGSLERRWAYVICAFLLMAGLITLRFVNPRLTTIAFILSINSFLYSWKKVRFKSIPFIDLFSHALAIGIQQLLITYYAFKPLDFKIFPYIGLVTSFSFATQLSQELRDYRIDEATNVRTTAQILGEKNAMILIVIFSSLPTFAALLLPKPLPYLAPIMAPAYLFHLNKRLGLPLEKLL